MKAKHTPGPWYAEMDCIQGAEKEDVATIASDSWENGRGRADAALIASAPELLEACKVALASDYLSKGIDEQLRKAIAKAEGQ